MRCPSHFTEYINYIVNGYTFHLEMELKKGVNYGPYEIKEVYELDR